MSDLVTELRKDVFYGDERMHRMAQHNPLHMQAADRITRLETKLREILTDATSLPHALTIAREGLHGEGGE